MKTQGGATHLECTLCGRQYESEALIRLSPCCQRPLYAQDGTSAQATDDSQSIGEIIVTAQKTEEKLSRAPLAVTALTGDALAKNHITDASSLASSVPGSDERRIHDR